MLLSEAWMLLFLPQLAVICSAILAAGTFIRVSHRKGSPHIDIRVGGPLF